MVKKGSKKGQKWVKNGGYPPLENPAYWYILPEGVPKRGPKRVKNGQKIVFFSLFSRFLVQNGGRVCVKKMGGSLDIVFGRNLIPLILHRWVHFSGYGTWCKNGPFFDAVGKKGYKVVGPKSVQIASWYEEGARLQSLMLVDPFLSLLNGTLLFFPNFLPFLTKTGTKLFQRAKSGILRMLWFGHEQGDKMGLRETVRDWSWGRLDEDPLKWTRSQRQPLRGPVHEAGSDNDVHP
jgi:hypothetical protein